LGYVREYLRSNTKILASVTLPQETFIPHGTGVKASLLFLQKLSKDKLEEAIKDNYRIFFAIVEKIGYEGNKNGSTIYKKNKIGEIIRDERGKSIVDEDLTEILKYFCLFRKNSSFIEKNNIFSIKYSELEDRLDAGYYKPEHRSLKKKLIKLNAFPLKEVVDIVTEKSKKLKNPEDKIKYVELSDVNSIYSELISYKEMLIHEAPSRASYDLREGYLITAIAGNSIGGIGHASAYVTKEFDGCVCTNGFRVLIPKKVNPFYLLFYLRSDYFLNQIFQKRSGAAIPAVSDEDFRNILIPMPSIKEQETIAEKMKESLELRAKSRLLFEELNKSYSEEKYWFKVAR
jgi:type I restriction enzyme M protein